MPLRRRLLFGTSAVGLAGMTLRSSAEEQPGALLGTVSDGKVSMPPLQAPTEGGASIPNLDPLVRRLGVAVVGLGHLSLEQILPSMGGAKHVRLAALVSGERDKARAVAAQYGVAEKNLYDYAGFDRLKDDPEVDIVYIVLPNGA